VEGGALQSVNGPVSFSDVDPPRDVAVPLLGEHTAEVLKELADRGFDGGSDSGDDGEVG